MRLGDWRFRGRRKRTLQTAAGVACGLQPHVPRRTSTRDRTFNPAPAAASGANRVASGPCSAWLPEAKLARLFYGMRNWTFAKAVPVVMMLALRDSPWRQPWNPARDIGPKVLVLCAKCLLERWFFVHQDDDVEKEPQQRGIPEEAPIAE